MNNAAIKYGAWLFVGSFLSQGLSYVSRLIMISNVDSISYGKFVLFWNSYLVILILSHLNLHSPIVYMLDGTIESLQSNNKLLYAPIQISIFSGSISFIILFFLSITMIGYSILMSFILSFSIIFYSAFVNMYALIRGVNMPKHGSYTFASLGLLRIIFMIISLLVSKGNSDLMVLSYVIPIYTLPIIIYFSINKIINIEISKIFSLVDMGFIFSLIKKSINVILSDLSSTGVILFLTYYIAKYFDITYLKPFDLILTIIRLSSLVLTNVGLTFIFAGKHIKSPRKMAIKTVVIGWFIILPLLSLIAVIFSRLGFITIFFNILNVNYTLEINELYILAFIVSSQFIAFIFSGFLQGRGYFARHSFSFISSFFLVVILTYFLLPQYLSVILSMLGIFYASIGLLNFIQIYVDIFNYGSDG